MLLDQAVFSEIKSFQLSSERAGTLDLSPTLVSVALVIGLVIFGLGEALLIASGAGVLGRCSHRVSRITPDGASALQPCYQRAGTVTMIPPA